MDREQRLQELHAWQRHYNMEPRQDSHLTELYVAGCLQISVDTVARELMATDFLYKHTLYGDLLQDFVRRVAYRIKDAYRLSWSSTWDVARFYAPIALKLISLMQTGQSIPPCLPPPSCEEKEKAEAGEEEEFSSEF